MEVRLSRNIKGDPWIRAKASFQGRIWNSRAVHNVTGEFLHLSGTGTTPDENLAWRGNKRMLKALGKDNEFRCQRIDVFIPDDEPEENDKVPNIYEDFGDGDIIL